MTSLDNITDQSQQDMPRHPDQAAQFSLSVDAAAALFVQAHVARSPRTISRYCENGYLECTKIDTETYQKYLISPASVERRIQELQSIAVASHVSTQPVMARHDAPRHDTSSHDEQFDEPRQASGETISTQEKRIKELEAENIDLKITNKGKDYFISELKEQNAALVDRVTKFSRYVGILKTKLLQLEAPKTYTSPIPQPQPAEFSELSSHQDTPSPMHES
jgi:hypothetical protein